jgi:G:T-mismatch repair DNA endonuclease (very short patch repair protein)
MPPIHVCYWRRHDCVKPEGGWKAADRRKILKDAKRHAFLASRDYDVHVFWECEIDKDPQAFRNQIKELAGK